MNKIKLMIFFIAIQYQKNWSEQSMYAACGFISLGVLADNKRKIADNKSPMTKHIISGGHIISYLTYFLNHLLQHLGGKVI